MNYELRIERKFFNAVHCARQPVGRQYALCIVYF
jgi:hypothetical protein